MLENGISPDLTTRGTSPLSLAAMNGHREIIDLLFEFGADPAAPGNENLLFSAVLGGDHDLINVAIEAGGDLHAPGLITAAIHRNRPKTVRYLIKLGCSIKEFEPLNCEWSRINREMILLLLDLGVDVPSDIAEPAVAGSW